MVWNIPWVSCPGCVHPNSLRSSRLLAGRVVRSPKGLHSVQRLLSNNKIISVLSTIFFAAQNQNAAPYQLLWRKLTHPQLKPANDYVCKCIFILYLVYWLRETVWNGMILNGDLESHKSALWNVIVLEAEHLWFFNYLVVLFHITVCEAVLSETKSSELSDVPSLKKQLKATGFKLFEAFSLWVLVKGWSHNYWSLTKSVFKFVGKHMKCIITYSCSTERFYIFHYIVHICIL